MTIEFQAWPKIARLNRDITITEKIDGTNAAIIIEEVDEHPGIFEICAQSRNRLLSVEKDNFGFARWVQDNASDLIVALGPGRHFGEWWGQGIQRRYGLTEKRFSLFNTARYGEVDFSALPQLGVVPVLYQGMFHEHEIDEVLLDLHFHGSRAAPGFERPEGIIIFHSAAQSMFKVTLEGDEAPKGLQL